MVANVQEKEKDGLIGPLRRQASDIGRRVKQGAKVLREQMTEKADQISRALREEADRVLSDKKGQAAQKLEKFGSAVHRVAHVLHAGKIDKVAEYVDMAAGRTNGLAKYLQDSDLDDMSADLGNVIRRHPLSVFGGALIGGVVLARLLIAAQADDEADEDAGSEKETEHSQARQRRLPVRRRITH